MTTLISKGTTCYGSKMGHYNFHYPDPNQKYELLISIEATRLSWRSADGYTAFKILKPLDYLPIKVVWVKAPRRCSSVGRAVVL